MKRTTLTMFLQVLEKSIIISRQEAKSTNTVHVFNELLNGQSSNIPLPLFAFRFDSGRSEA
jgi:hypothetical protein